MRLGKLSNEMLERLILSKYKRTRSECVNMPRIGDDCALVDLGSDIVVLSTDPITSATEHLGRLSVHISCNDAAAAGAEPVGILVTLLAPPTATQDEIAAIAEELSQTAKEVGVDVLGGHTEVTDSVTRYITSTTVVARQPRGRALIGMRPGDDIVLTKWAGLEGSVLIASDFRDKLPMLSAADHKELAGWLNHLSVVPEGRYCSNNGATAMHDVTEGGIFGAAWEMSYAAGVGITLDEQRIPVSPITKRICEALGLDPMRLLSSGCMLIACEDGEALSRGLNTLKIPATIIGKAIGEGLRLKSGEPVNPPEADELYRLFA